MSSTDVYDKTSVRYVPTDRTTGTVRVRMVPLERRCWHPERLTCEECDTDVMTARAEVAGC